MDITKVINKHLIGISKDGVVEVFHCDNILLDSSTLRTKVSLRMVFTSSTNPIIKREIENSIKYHFDNIDNMIILEDYLDYGKELGR